jgi:hypothetical protein
MAANGTAAAPWAQVRTVHRAQAALAGRAWGEHCQAVSCVTPGDSREIRICIPLEMRNPMPHTVRQLIAFGWLGTAILCSAGCAPKRAPPLTVADLMEDRVMLDGVLLKCNEGSEKARNESDCLNARIAIDRLAQQDIDPKEEAKRNAEFERSREQLRLVQEKKRQEQEEKTKVDAYSLPVVPVVPVVPVEPTPGAASSGTAAPGGATPGLAQTKP